MFQAREDMMPMRERSKNKRRNSGLNVVRCGAMWCASTEKGGPRRKISNSALEHYAVSSVSSVFYLFKCIETLNTKKRFIAEILSLGKWPDIHSRRHVIAYLLNCHLQFCFYCHGPFQSLLVRLLGLYISRHYELYHILER